MREQEPAQTTLPAPQAVALSGVSVGYHGRPVVEGLCLDIGAGEMVGLLGPNGAGKTTLLRCLCGLCPPLEGTACLFGRPLELLGPTERARLVAVVPQEVETPAVRQMQIEENKSVVDRSERSIGVVKPLDPVHGVIGALQMRGNGLAERGLILNQQNTH